jgi:hypothetical protein
MGATLGPGQFGFNLSQCKCSNPRCERMAQLNQYRCEECWAVAQHWYHGKSLTVPLMGGDGTHLDSQGVRHSQSLGYLSGMRDN